MFPTLPIGLAAALAASVLAQGTSSAAGHMGLAWDGEGSVY